MKRESARIGAALLGSRETRPGTDWSSVSLVLSAARKEAMSVLGSRGSSLTVLKELQASEGNWSRKSKGE